MVGKFHTDDVTTDQILKDYDGFYSDHQFMPLEDEVSVNADQQIPRVGWALDFVHENRPSKVLDLCCLDGFASLTIAAKTGIPCVGVDLSRQGVEIAQAKAKKFNLPAEYHQSNIEEWSGGKFPLVLLFEAIEHFPDVQKTLAHIKTLMTPGASLMVTTPEWEGQFGQHDNNCAHLRIYNKSDEDQPDTPSLYRELTQAGFEVVERHVWNDLLHYRAILK